MKYLSICSGIEAATVAWHPLGWEPVAFAEIDKFPRAVLKHHWPKVHLHGDFTTIKGAEYGPVDLLVGGTPCQSFSIAGLRGGMADDRGNLALQFLALAGRTGARWIVWENVPGVLSSSGGRDFGAFLGGLEELGYGWAYRVLDAQHFGVPQRRRRVFVVGHLGDWRRAAAVLFERASLQWHPAPSREAGQRVAGTLETSTHDWSRNEPGAGIVHSLRADGFDASEDGTGRGTPLVAHAFDARQSDVIQYGDRAGPLDTDGWTQAIAFDTTQITSAANRSRPKAGDPCHPLAASSHPPAIAFSSKDHGADAGDLAPTLRAMGHSGSHANAGGQVAVAFGISSDAIDRSGEGDGSAGERAGLGIVENASPSLRSRPNNSVATAAAVRRLTPRECERLQGFPDDWTLIPYRGKPAADGPRYKAIGNSMAVPVMRWIGRRIQMVETLARRRKA